MTLPKTLCLACLGLTAFLATPPAVAGASTAAEGVPHAVRDDWADQDDLYEGDVLRVAAVAGVIEGLGEVAGGRADRLPELRRAGAE